MFAFALAQLLFSEPAHATVTSARAFARADNVLRYDFRIQTTESAQVTAQYWVRGTPPAGAVTTASSATGTTHVVPAWGFAAGTTYNFRVRVTPTTGLPYTYTAPRPLTTGALPTDLPTFVATTVTGAPDFDYLLLDTHTTDDSQGLLVILDDTAAVRWYQRAPAGTDTFGPLYFDEAAGELYALVDYDRVVRYAMDGTLTADWELGAELSDYTHHEITVYDGVVYVLTARLTNLDGLDYIEDGIQGYDDTGTLVYEWWANEDGGLNVTDNEPFNWYTPGSGPWGPTFPTGYDWLHANSLQVRDTTDGVKFYVSMRHTSQVVKVDAATGTVDWLLGQNDTGSTDASGDFTMSPFGVSTTWWQLQHHAHYESNGRMYVYDNGDERVTRLLELQVNEATNVVRISREVDYSDFVSFGFDGNCHSEGSVYLTTGGHLLGSCSTELFVADFDPSNQLTWHLDVVAPGHVYRATPLASLGY